MEGGHTVKTLPPQQFRVAMDAEYEVRQRSTLILNVHAQNTPTQSVLEESFHLEPRLPGEQFLSETGGNRFVRLDTGRATSLRLRYRALVETRPRLVPRRRIDTVPVAHLNREAISYLFPSRYCQSDRLGRLAASKFARHAHPYEKVTAIVDWIHGNVEYLAGTTDSATSAFDTITQRSGVCRDFAHLGIALCRALSIPARYFAGYACQLDPPDFHACFEAHIGGEWYVFDATHLAPLNGLVRIATGHDAADASFATLFGPLLCQHLVVSCEPAGDPKSFRPCLQRSLVRKGLTLDYLAPAPPRHGSAPFPTTALP